MKIHKVIEFLEGVEKAHGNIQLQSVTGFWVRQTPKSGEWVVICSKGDGYIDVDELYDPTQRTDKFLNSVEKYYFNSMPNTDNSSAKDKNACN